MHSLIAKVLVALAVVVALAGCGGGKKATATATPPPTAKPAPPPVAPLTGLPDPLGARSAPVAEPQAPSETGARSRDTLRGRERGERP